MAEFLAEPPRPLKSGDPALLTVKLSKLTGIRALVVDARLPALGELNSLRSHGVEPARLFRCELLAQGLEQFTGALLPGGCAIK